MAYGWDIDLGTIVGESDYGRIVRFNLAQQEPKEILQVQLKKETGGVYSTPVTVPVSSETLAGYLASTDPPDVAFRFSGMQLDVFCAIGYAFTSDTQVAIWYVKNAANGVAMNNVAEVPQQAERLVILIALRNLRFIECGKIDKDMQREIDKEVEGLGL